MLPSANKTTEILSPPGAAGRITRLPPTRSCLPVIRSVLKTQWGLEGGENGSSSGWGVDKRHVYTGGSGTVGLLDVNWIRSSSEDFGEGPNEMDLFVDRVASCASRKHFVTARGLIIIVLVRANKGI